MFSDSMVVSFVIYFFMFELYRYHFCFSGLWFRFQERKNDCINIFNFFFWSFSFTVIAMEEHVSEIVEHFLLIQNTTSLVVVALLLSFKKKKKKNTQINTDRNLAAGVWEDSRLNFTLIFLYIKIVLNFALNMWYLPKHGKITLHYIKYVLFDWVTHSVFQ